MQVEVKCPRCECRLKVPAGAGGKQAICAVCQNVFSIGNVDPPSGSAFQEDAPPNPYATGGQSAALYRVSPHRGGIVLALSLLGWFFCPVFSVAAWLMGRGDLRKMDRGTMDNAGRTVTQAGTVVAIVNCVAIALGIAAMILMLVFGAFAAAI